MSLRDSVVMTRITTRTENYVDDIHMNSIDSWRKNYFCNWGKPAKQCFADLLVWSNSGIISLSYDTLIVIVTDLLLTKKHFDKTWKLSTFLDWFWVFFFSLSFAKVITTLNKRKHNEIISLLSSAFGLCFHCLFKHLLPILSLKFY